MKKKFYVLVEIVTLDSQTQTAARDRVLRWIETFGHTAPNHGFEFLTVTGASDVSGNAHE